MVASQKPRSKAGAITPATPYPTPARPTSHWKRLVGQPMAFATGAGVDRCALPSKMPLTPTSQKSPTSSAVTFQSSTPAPGRSPGYQKPDEREVGEVLPDQQADVPSRRLAPPLLVRRKQRRASRSRSSRGGRVAPMASANTTLFERIQILKAGDAGGTCVCGHVQKQRPAMVIAGRIHSVLVGKFLRL